MRVELFIQENAVPNFSGLFLEWQCDQVPETAFGQSVLIGEESVIGVQSDIRTSFQCFRQDMSAEFPGQRGGDGVLEKPPQVSAIA